MNVDFQQACALASQMAMLKHELGVAGLFRTMQLMDRAVQEVGFEIDDAVTAAETVGESDG